MNKIPEYLLTPIGWLMISLVRESQPFTHLKSARSIGENSWCVLPIKQTGHNMAIEEPVNTDSYWAWRLPEGSKVYNIDEQVKYSLRDWVSWSSMVYVAFPHDIDGYIGFITTVESLV